MPQADPMTYEAYGVRLDVVPRPPRGRLVTGRHPIRQKLSVWVLRTPGFALLGVILIPLAWALAEALLHLLTTQQDDPSATPALLLHRITLAWIIVMAMLVIAIGSASQWSEQAAKPPVRQHDQQEPRTGHVQPSRLWARLRQQPPKVARLLSTHVRIRRWSIWASTATLAAVLLVAGRQPEFWISTGLLLAGALLFRVPSTWRITQARFRFLIGSWVIVSTTWTLAAISPTFDADGVWAYFRTLVWVAYSVLLLALGLWIAWRTRSVRWPWWPLVLPFAVSALVTGVACRLVFGPGLRVLGLVEAFHGIVAETLLAWVLLLFAFTWTWLGFLILVFRAAFEAVDDDPARQENLRRVDEAGGWLRRLGRLLAMVRQTVLVLGIAVGVAAARVFDLILIAVPGSLQYDVDSAGVHWWRLTSSGGSIGEASAYTLPLVIAVAVGAWVLRPGRSSGWYSTGRPILRRRTSLETGRLSNPAGRNLLGPAVGIGLLLLPVGVLFLAAIHDPWTSGQGAWLSPYGIKLDAFAVVWENAQLDRSLWTTLSVASLATLLTIGAAAPLAYLLASRPHQSLESRFFVAAFALLAMLPVQMYLGPLRQFVGYSGLSGTQVPLILVHVAVGIPFAVLVLRAALYAPKNTPAADALYGLTSPWTTLRRTWQQAGPALIAVSVLQFIQVWNDFIISLLLSGTGAGPLSLLLWGEARQFDISADTVAAGALIWTVIPVGLLLLTWRRWIVPGLTGKVT